MKRIITISREYGSGGRMIGKAVSEKLGIKFYDKELIALVAKESGFDINFVKETGEYSTTGSLLFNIAMSNMYGNSFYTGSTLSTYDKIHIMQSNIIKDIADSSPALIVGRSADYILRERNDCIHVFIYAAEQDKIKTVSERYGIDEKAALKLLQKTDKGRAAHYKHYTEQIWGMAKNYTICLNSSVLGIQGCVDVICSVFSDDLKRK